MSLSGFKITTFKLDFPGWLIGKESDYNAGEPGSILGYGKFPGEGNCKLL